MSLACFDIEQLDEIAAESAAFQTPADGASGASAGVNGGPPSHASAALSAAQREHLDSCASCRAKLLELQANIRMQDSLRRLLGSRPSADSGSGQRAAGLERFDGIPEIPGFEVIRQIGRGGMGVVYEARQLAPARIVALKVARDGGDSARFGRQIERETAALARLAHPNIATLYAAGTTVAGQSWFAIERIDGVRLTDFGRDRPLSIEERLRIFLPVCDAIAYVHGRGVIHRDIKPSNILVERDGRARVLDFGLAKLLQSDEDRSDITLTAVGRIHGTIPYMSPEQVRGGSVDVDVQSEVYSLGVVLYEWLCGGLPYTTDPRDLLAAARTIAQTPPRPPRSLNREISPDLATVMLKALEKEPGRRYGSVAAMADDLRRVLAREPITARPATAAYQLRTLIRRHPIVSGLVALLVLSTIGYAVGVTQALRSSDRNMRRAIAAESDARSKGDAAQKAAARAAKVTSLLRGIFASADPRRGGDPNATAREVLERGTEKVLQGAIDDDLTRAELLFALGEAHHHLSILDKSRSLLEQSLAIYRRYGREHETTIGQICHELGQLCHLLGDREASLGYFRQTAEILARHFDADDFHSVMLVIAQLRAAEDWTALLPLLDSALANLPAEPRFEKSRISFMNYKAEALSVTDRLPEAIATMRETIRILDAADDPDGRPAIRASIEGNLGWLLMLNGQLDEAQQLATATLEYRRRTQSPTHIELSTTLLTLGAIQSRRGNCAAAIPLFEEALQIRRGHFPADDDRIREVERWLAECTEKP